jgi:hypothetical protein
VACDVVVVAFQAVVSSQGSWLFRHHHMCPRSLVARFGQGGVVVVPGGASAVVVRAGAWGLGEHGEGPPVAGVAEPLVADLAGLDVVRTGRMSG